MFRYSAFSIIFLLISCSQSNIAPSSGQQSKKFTKPVVPIHWRGTIDSENYYSDSETALSGDETFMLNLKNSLDSEEIIPVYSQNLSLMAYHISSITKNLVSPYYIYNLSQHYGITVPWVFQTWLESKDDFSPASVNETLKYLIEKRKITHFGIARFKDKNKSRILILSQKRNILFPVIPRIMEGKIPSKIEGVLNKNYDNLEVTVKFSNNTFKTWQIALSANNYFKLSFKLCNKSEDKMYVFQFLASSHTGASVVADFPIYCKRLYKPERPVVMLMGSTAEISESEFASEVILRINQYRKSLGLSIFSTDKSLNTVSQSHSQEMCALDSILHVSPTTGKPEDRLKKSEIEVHSVAENVASGNTPDEIVKGWISSETHRQNLISPFSAAGIGVCRKSYSDGTYSFFTTLMLIQKK
ncbi:hypothetical protein KKF34_13020 [Myxococcota bacterium]|nr:hypothetical protein [Myxococcota bacterium]MBU1381888.1 hypothetical protein [Myxococcota bacterium]MBU1497789.1 hypothetical protein [Myxococcota bacterium]